MITPCYDEHIFNVEIKTKIRSKTSVTGIIENHNGDTMFVADTITIELEEDTMNLEPNSPLTFKGALSIAGGTLLIIGGVLWAAYTQVQGQITDLRGEVSTLRSSNHDDFNRVSDKLDDIGKTLTTIQVEQATQKAKSSSPTN